jgi:hypothetical protein
MNKQADALRIVIDGCLILVDRGDRRALICDGQSGYLFYVCVGRQTAE